MENEETVKPEPEVAPKKATKKAPAKKKAAAKKKPSVKKSEGFGVSYIAKQLKKEPNLVRIQLRNKSVKKPGKSYIWPTKAAADAVVKKLKAA